LKKRGAIPTNWKKDLIISWLDPNRERKKPAKRTWSRFIPLGVKGYSERKVCS